jgi:hypothetical protein
MKTASGMATPRSIKRLVLALTLLCYSMALILPGLVAREPNSYGYTSSLGYVCLLFGWITIFGGLGYFFPWLANLFYLPGLLLWLLPTRSPRWGAIFPVIGLGLATLTFRIETIMVNEAGHRVAVQPGIGAWLWMASFALLLLGFLGPQHWKPTAETQTAAKR